MSSGSHYVNKEEFYQQVKANREARDRDSSVPISHEVASSIYKICQGVCSRYNFYNYSYRDEMVSDAVLNCIKYFDNFDAVNYNNPFGYFSFVAYRSAQRRILVEKKQQAVKAKYIKNLSVEDEMFDDDKLQEYQNYLGDFFNFDLDAYEATTNKKKDNT